MKYQAITLIKTEINAFSLAFSFLYRQTWLKQPWFSYQKSRKANKMWKFFKVCIILDDQLYGIIYIPQWVYKSKYIHWLWYWLPFVCIVYLCFTLHFAITKWEKLLMQDIRLAVVCAGVLKILCIPAFICLSVNYGFRSWCVLCWF